ncbi:MAG: polyphosphate kinase 2 family protein [Dehalococcoidia bacterium]|nr:polyphosphate kinase 2 family protein [Dehalococcoidia bacterium]
MSNGKNAVPPFGEKFKLQDFDTSQSGGMTKEQGETKIAELRVRLNELQDLLYADGRFGMLVVLQGIDTGGKDGTIKSVFQEVGPIGCQVVAFKVPTPEELAHPYLWRYQKETPEKGHITIFNRSHYEAVLVERVKNIVPKDTWERRFDDINHWEEFLVRNGTEVMKFALLISKDEQRERLQERIDNPRKQWKFRMGDLDDRKLWDEYQEAYSDVITRTNTKHAPWHAVPADRKWYRDIVVAEAMIAKLESMDLRYPPADPQIVGLKVQ